MIQLNLLPDLKKEFIKAQKTKSLVISMSILVTVGAIALSALLFVYVTFVQQLQINIATDDIKKRAAELQAIPEVNKYLSVQNQLAAVTELHDKKGMHSRLFSFLNVLNPSPPNNMTLDSVQLNAPEKTIVFSGTSKTFESLNIFVDTLKNANVKYKSGGQGDFIEEPMFQQVYLQSSGLARSSASEGVTFVIKGIYRDPVFDARNTEVSAQVPNITTTQSTTQAPAPQQLFNDSGDQ